MMGGGAWQVRRLIDEDRKTLAEELVGKSAASGRGIDDWRSLRVIPSRI